MVFLFNVVVKGNNEPKKKQVVNIFQACLMLTFRSDLHAIVIAVEEQFFHGVICDNCNNLRQVFNLILQNVFHIHHLPPQLLNHAAYWYVNLFKRQ